MPVHQHLEFRNLDALTGAARAFDLDFRPLEPGAVSASMFQTGGEAGLVSSARVNRPTEQRGSTPAGARTFVVPAASDLRMHWRGHRVEGDHLLLFPASNELHAVTRADFEVFTLSLPPEALDAAARALGRPGLERALREEVFRPDSRRLDELRERLRLLRDAARAGAPDTGTPATGAAERAAAWIRDELPVRVVELLLPAEPSRTIDSRDRLLARVQRYLAGHLAESPGVADLCRVAGVSERTLQYAFRERYGVTPKAYLRARRLAEVHRRLQRAPREPVADAAGRWGFWHMGQFAGDYRRLFGELPSDTRRRAAAVR